MKASAMIDGQAPVETFDEIDSTILEARRRAERNELGARLANRPQHKLQAVAAVAGHLGVAPMAICSPRTLFATKRQPASHIALLSFATGLAIAEDDR